MKVQFFWNDKIVLFNPASPVLRSFLAVPGVSLLSAVHLKNPKE